MQTTLFKARTFTDLNKELLCKIWFLFMIKFTIPEKLESKIWDLHYRIFFLISLVIEIASAILHIPFLDHPCVRTFVQDIFLIHHHYHRIVRVVAIHNTFIYKTRKIWDLYCRLCFLPLIVDLASAIFHFPFFDHTLKYCCRVAFNNDNDKHNRNNSNNSNSNK